MWEVREAVEPPHKKLLEENGWEPFAVTLEPTIWNRKVQQYDYRVWYRKQKEEKTE